MVAPVNEQPPHFSSSVGTWDEWLVMRETPVPDPETGAATLSDAEYVAAIMQLPGSMNLLDMGIPLVRQGFRDLFDQFEADTGGAVQFRAPTVPSGSMVVNVAAVERHIALAIGDPQNSHEAQSMYLSLESAIEFAEKLIAAIQSIRGDADSADS